jgi:S-adenosylmethionine decarboxylase
MKKETKPILGYHLILDGYSENKEALGSSDKIRMFLSKLPKELGMRIIYEPVVVRELDPPDPAWGLSGFVMIAESHISIHTFPDKEEEKGCLHADVFSCKKFSKKVVLNRFREAFGLFAVGELGQVKWVVR